VIHLSSDSFRGSDLLAAAFGELPASWPLPTAMTPDQLWLRAVAAGGQGRYGSAHADLTVLLRAGPPGRLASLALSARASFLRQLGWHGLARGWDGRALALAGDDPESVGDALIGLAADALGVGRLAASATLLARAEPVVTRAPQRVAVRWAWVSAEWAMAAGEGSLAVRNAEVAVELAATTLAFAARHRAKSQVVLAAALCSAGAVDRARTVADAALDLTGGLGLTPLRWALACLLADLSDAQHRITQLRDIRDDCARRVEHWGGTWRRP